MDLRRFSDFTEKIPAWVMSGITGAAFYLCANFVLFILASCGFGPMTPSCKSITWIYSSLFPEEYLENLLGNDVLNSLESFLGLILLLADTAIGFAIGTIIYWITKTIRKRRPA